MPANQQIDIWSGLLLIGGAFVIIVVWSAFKVVWEDLKKPKSVGQPVPAKPAVPTQEDKRLEERKAVLMRMKCLSPEAARDLNWNGKRLSLEEVARQIQRHNEVTIGDGQNVIYACWHDNAKGRSGDYTDHYFRIGESAWGTGTTGFSYDYD